MTFRRLIPPRFDVESFGDHYESLYVALVVYNMRVAEATYEYLDKRRDYWFYGKNRRF